jgi:hypothetical protein
MNLANKEESSIAVSTLGTGQALVQEKSRPLSTWLWLILPLGYLWFHLIDNLRFEWSSNPQYSYGLVVPILVVGLLVRRWHQVEGEPWLPPAGSSRPAMVVSGILAFLYLPTRLIEAATPEWRPLQWALAVETVGLTLYAIYLAGGKFWLRQAAFPVTFFLVAVPWPTPIEQPIIQSLSRMNAAVVVEVLDCGSIGRAGCAGPGAWQRH